MTSHNQTSKNKLLLIGFARNGLIIAFHISDDIDIINRGVLIFMDFVVHKVLSRKNIMLLAHQIKEKCIVIYIYYIWKHHDQYTKSMKIRTPRLIMISQ
jgi:hypothetical protein